MRTLKKTLALVLVVAMALSFGVIGANAAFTDTASSNYTEAISVLSGIGVINGMTDTTFDPAGNLTREQAAKIIAYMLLGPTNAQLISTATSQKFADVAADRWSAGYIEYCANLGIINGVGDNNFDPAGTLTTAAFTKMLLCAVGYKADVEGLTGTSWAINTASLAVSAGIYDSNIAISASTAMTREQAAQVAYKTLTAKTVQYTGGSTITIGDSTITTGATRSFVTYTTPSTTAVKYNGTDDGYVQFCEKYFPKLTNTTTATVDGRTGYYWLNGTTYVSDFITADTTLATSTNGTAFSTLTDATSTKYIGYKPDTTVTYYYQDTEVTATYPANSNLAANVTTVEGYAATAGVVVKFIDSDSNGKYDIVSVVAKTVYQLAAAPTVKTTGSVTTVNIGPLSNILSSNITYPSGLVKGDVVLYYQAGSDYYFEKATAVSATMTSYSSKGFVIGGTTYGLAALSGVTIPGTALTDAAKLQALIGAAGYTYYIDGNSNVCYVVAPDGAATLTNTFYVAATQATTSFGTTTYQAAVVAPDGTQSTITVAKTASYGGTLTAVAGNVDESSTSGNLGAGLYYTYAVNSSGTYNLTAAQYQSINKTDLTVAATAGSNNIDVNDTSFTVTAGVAKFLSKVTCATDDTWTGASSAVQAPLATSSTVFMVYDSTAKTYTTYTGIANAPSYKAGGTITVLMDSTNTYAQLVVCAGASTSASATSYDKIFVTSDASTSLDSNGTPVFSYTAVVNGVVGETFESYTALNAGTLYFCKEYTTAGVAVSGACLTGVAGTAHATLNDIAYAGGTFVVDAATDAAYILSSDVVIFMYDTSEGSITQITPEAAAAYTYANAASDYLTVLPVSSTDSTIAAVYITVA